jgi:hypothetical protein
MTIVQPSTVLRVSRGEWLPPSAPIDGGLIGTHGDPRDATTGGHLAMV